MNLPNASFSKPLIAWYLQNKRSLPWRQTKDPYKIWLSEIMLQQTRVEQGLPYYEKFLLHFPKVEDLANASEQEVLKLWQGLGYYSRARNLHATAKYVAFECSGVFPNNYKDLKKLKGVGDYTASAIASICFDEAAAVVDGNVYRALSRSFGIDTPIDSSAGQKEFKALAQELIDPSQPGTFNQAMMEFGARLCKPRNPDCPDCFFKDRCIALATDKIGSLPVKKGKTKVRKRYFNYIVPQGPEGQTLLIQKETKGIWHKLFEFPNLETAAPATAEEVTGSTVFKEIFKAGHSPELLRYNDEPVRHKLSHQHLEITFWIASYQTALEGAISQDQLQDFPVPVVLERFINSYNF
ncbi:A/G-specific adenine glycosylase [Gilvibacter sediminis]|uniref:A/G-specific adenine glycosylase n=1 Tax=Gilvibacter sediminis TaxID=379071 RepID=UPI0023508A65|nr:A/G-specific adenine glycosylase [Gilvibacter sediminis]MDC7997158.1 A/G-specific adenine glycosylase [Gilvibacter sediminis]